MTISMKSFRRAWTADWFGAVALAVAAGDLHGPRPAADPDLGRHRPDGGPPVARQPDGVAEFHHQTSKG